MKFTLNETLVQVFSCEICENFRNTNFTEHLQMTASKALINNPIVLFQQRLCGWRSFNMGSFEGCTFHFLEFNLRYVYIFGKAWILIVFWNSEFRNILTLLYLNLELSAHVQIPITCFYILVTIFLTWYEVETYMGNTLW